MSMKTLTVIGGSLLLAASLVAAEDEINVDMSKIPPAPKKEVKFEKDIKPVLEKSGCFKCHGEEKQKAKLRVDQLKPLLKGSSAGKIVIPKKPEKSLLLLSVARLDEDYAMPPEGKGKNLTKDQIALVRAWIDQGAK